MKRSDVPSEAGNSATLANNEDPAQDISEQHETIDESSSNTVRKSQREKKRRMQYGGATVQWSGLRFGRSEDLVRKRVGSPKTHTTTGCGRSVGRDGLLMPRAPSTFESRNSLESDTITIEPRHHNPLQTPPSAPTTPAATTASTVANEGAPNPDNAEANIVSEPSAKQSDIPRMPPTQRRSPSSSAPTPITRNPTTKSDTLIPLETAQHIDILARTSDTKTFRGDISIPFISCNTDYASFFATIIAECELSAAQAATVRSMTASFAGSGRKLMLRRDKESDWVKFGALLAAEVRVLGERLQLQGVEVWVVVHLMSREG